MEQEGIEQVINVGDVQDNGYVPPYVGLEEPTTIKEEMTYYELLRITPAALTKDITAAYKNLALIYHPDKLSKEETDEKFKIIAEAYAILKDPKSRAAYDNSVATATFEPSSSMTAEERMQFDSADAARLNSHNPSGTSSNRFVLPKCAEYRTRVVITTQQVFTGANLSVPIKRKVTCVQCSGTGGDGGRIEMCSRCSGCGVNIRRMKQASDTTSAEASTIHFTHGCTSCGTLGVIVKNKTGACTYCCSRGWLFRFPNWRQSGTSRSNWRVISQASRKRSTSFCKKDSMKRSQRRSSDSMRLATNFCRKNVDWHV